MNLIDTNSVIIIHGPTGCGKTTQVPQYIIDDCKEKNVPCNIVVTQPRRIAAINIAQRVCKERGWALGTVCGYQVGLNKNVGEDVILTYMTTEVLLQKLLLAKNLNRYTHVIIDEVHERNKALDFLLLIVRKFLYTNSNSVKVILMSATMEADKFAYYFRCIPRNLHDKYLLAPVLDVNKKSEFTTNICYTDQLSTIGKIAEYDINTPYISIETYNLCLALILYFNKIDEVDIRTNEKIIGSVLVFLPGYHEIEEMHKILMKCDESRNWTIVPLHSTLSTDYLSKAFEPPGPGYRKIILSTNIAESSITVPDVYYVIDFCLTKIMTMNQQTKFASLQLQWATHNNCIQRAGRVGRVANGRVYRLVPKDFYNNEMQANTVPELQRSPLENIILYMKLLDLNDTPKNVLALALDPPNLKDVENCIWHLKEVGALLPTCRNKQSASDGDITFIGKIMGQLPLDIHLTKLIILGHMFSCLDEAVIMAAGATTRNLFIRNFHNKIQSYNKKLLWADSSNSDLISLLNLYNVWISLKRNHSFRNTSDEFAWCKKNFVNWRGIREWELLIREIHNRLKNFSIESPPGSVRAPLSTVEKPIILKVIICGAFYPNYFLRSTEYGQIDIKEAVKTIGGRDPYTTVYFTNMATDQPGHIYAKQVKKLMNADDNAIVNFDANSKKIYVQFKKSKDPETITINGKQYIASIGENVATEVYEAIRKRHCNVPFHLKILPSEIAWKFFNNQKEKKICDEDILKVDYNPLPPLDIQYMSIIITHINDPTNFYCQNYNEETGNLLNGISDCLNKQPISRVEGSIQINNLYAARYFNGSFYRCKVLSTEDRPFPTAHIFYIDYGNTEKVPIEDLRELPDDAIVHIAPIAVRCTLTYVRPIRNLNNKWSEAAIREFKQKTNNYLIFGKVYSVVNDIVSLELYYKEKDVANNSSFNQYLLNKNLAEKQEESYLSRMDHERRSQVLNSEQPHFTASQIDKASNTTYFDFDSPDTELEKNAEIIELKGPFSPLETKVHGIVKAASGAMVNIDSESINSVLLDDNPEDPHSRLLVAGNVGQAANGQKLILYQTSLMPNIPGFPAMMLLLFCPQMEPKINKEGTRVSSILCGLGYKEIKKIPNYPIHDIAYALDIEVTKDLIALVNQLRYIMNDTITCMSNLYEWGFDNPQELVRYQTCLKDKIFSLIQMKTQPIPQEKPPYYDIWAKFACNDIKLIQLDLTCKTPIWKMHWFVELNDEKGDRRLFVENLNQLNSIAKRLIPEEQIVCLLCKSEVLRNIGDVRHHLIDKVHKMNLEDFNSNL